MLASNFKNLIRHRAAPVPLYVSTLKPCEQRLGEPDCITGLKNDWLLERHDISVV